MACTLIFTFEILAKFVGLGVRSTLRDPYNRFDALLVAVGIPQLAIAFAAGGEGGGNLFSVFRLLRVARVLRLGRRWGRLRRVITIVLGSMASVAYLSLLVLLVLFIFSVLGMQLFGETVEPPPPYPTDHPKRLGFGSLWRSLLTVFVVITGEGWATVMVGAMGDAGAGAAAYFVALFVVGRYVMLNLFIAIIIDRFR
eukprot:gene32327-7733_t